MYDNDEQLLVSRPHDGIASSANTRLLNRRRQIADKNRQSSRMPPATFKIACCSDTAQSEPGSLRKKTPLTEEKTQMSFMNTRNNAQSSL